MVVGSLAEVIRGYVEVVQVITEVDMLGKVSVQLSEALLRSSEVMPRLSRSLLESAWLAEPQGPWAEL